MWDVWNRSLGLGPVTLTRLCIGEGARRTSFIAETSVRTGTRLIPGLITARSRCPSELTGGSWKWRPVYASGGYRESS